MRLRWAACREVGDETTVSAQLVARLLSWLAGGTAQRLSAYGNLIPRRLAFVPSLHSRQQAPASRQTPSDGSYGDGSAGISERLRGAAQISIGTRNCRLAAVRSFFAFLLDREPLTAGQCAEVLRIPVKRAPQRELFYLEEHEVAAILAEPDRSTLEGQRDHTLLAFLYNTGARIQEALDICPRSLRLDTPAQVRLVGKGRKERLCPLWPETTALLRALLQRTPREPDQRVFLNRYGEPLGAAGVRFKLAQYVKRARKKVPSLAGKDVSPHTFRIQRLCILLQQALTSQSSVAGWATPAWTRRITTHVPASTQSARPLKK